MSYYLRLNKANCRHCYKCIRHCSVKSIRFSEDQAHVMSQGCILCGNCVSICPQKARQIINDTGRVKAMLRSGVPVYVSLAPSFIANYDGADLAILREALKKLGFADAEETAIGAAMVKREFERLLKEEQRDILITSCCHSVNLLIQQYYPSLLPYLADVLSPMQAHCQDLKKRYPGCYTVFIGPCIAKKHEAEVYPGYVDAVLTFEELTEWMNAEGIFPEADAAKSVPTAKETSQSTPIGAESSAASSFGLTRFFPTAGGVIRTLSEQLPGYTYLAVDGVDNCRRMLEDIESGNIHKCFIEMNTCVGSCINGPGSRKKNRQPLTDYLYVARYAGNEDFPIPQPAPEGLRKAFAPIDNFLPQPTEEEITEALHRMGKYTKADELNCGSCGYSNCRRKAISVCQGTSEITMCLPYMQRMQNYSDNIVELSPISILVLNDDLEVQLANPAALSLFGLRSQAELVGQMVSEFIDPLPFIEAMDGDRYYQEDRVYLDKYDRYVKITVVYEPKYHQYIGLLDDKTAQISEQLKQEEISRQTAEIADKVVEKQMRIVQEIACLLGETTAETRVALNKLKESVKND